MKYDSWFMEMLDIGHRLERNIIRYKLTVRGKPYFHDWGYIMLEEPGKLFYTYQKMGERNQTLCMETAPDTALERVRLDQSFLGACQENYLPMSVDEAMTIARQTFQLDQSIICTRAMPLKEQYSKYSSICTTNEKGYWYIGFKVESSDTTVYYRLKIYSVGEEEIQRILKKRNKRDGTCECPEIVLTCQVDAQTGNICLVNINYRMSSDELGDIPERLYPFARRVKFISDSLATEYWR